MKFKVILLFSAVAYNLQAMTQTIRKSPIIARTAVGAARRTPGRWATPTALGASAQAPIRIHAQKAAANPQKISRVSQAVGAAIVAAPAVAFSAAVIAQATGLAERASELFNPEIFDDKLTSDEFRDAVVRLYEIDQHITGPAMRASGQFTAYSQASAFIVREGQHYFVITAAHCLKENRRSIIALRASGPVWVAVEPVVVDTERDVAVLLITPQELAAVNMPVIAAIPASLLSAVEPHEKEAVLIQGFPHFLHDAPYNAIYENSYIKASPNFVDKEFHKDYPIAFRSNYEKDERRLLQGASGGPIIAWRDGRYIVIGVQSKELREPKRGVIIPGGIGVLPEYMRLAQQAVQAQQVETDAQIAELGEKIRRLQLHML